MIVQTVLKLTVLLFSALETRGLGGQQRCILKALRLRYVTSPGRAAQQDERVATGGPLRGELIAFVADSGRLII